MVSPFLAPSNNCPLIISFIILISSFHGIFYNKINTMDSDKSAHHLVVLVITKHFYISRISIQRGKGKTADLLLHEMEFYLTKLHSQWVKISVGIELLYIYRYQTKFLPSVSINIEISDHRCFPRETFQTLASFSSFPKCKQKWCFRFSGK